MPQSRWDSGHVIVHVTHPSGEVHSIAFPDDMGHELIHGALDLAGYFDKLDFTSIPGHIEHPTREGAIEYSPAFRAAAQKAIKTSRNFEDPGEAAFAIGPYGKPVETPKGEQVIQYSPVKDHTVISQPDDKATFHTHPASMDPKPSRTDVESAKKTGKVMMVASRDGLYEVGPDGKPQQVFTSRTWYSDQNPR